MGEERSRDDQLRAIIQQISPVELREKALACLVDFGFRMRRVPVLTKRVTLYQLELAQI